MKKTIVLLLILIRITLAGAQPLQPGFDIDEYIEMLKIMKKQFPGFTKKKFPEPQFSQLLYASPETDLKNQWNLWLYKSSIAVISIRGTTPNMPSWAENFYTAMVPASGMVRLNDSTTVKYRLASDSLAAVHAGWLVGMTSIAPDVEKHLKRLHDSLHIANVIVTGHSQGGAISYLLTAYLRYRMKDGQLPSFRMKTYCSAAPKPGNVYFAYDYELITGNMAFNVVNTADWVPQVPLSVETIDDLNPINPFVVATVGLSNLKFPKNLILKHVFNKVKKSADKTRDYYLYYFGKKMYPIIASYTPQLKEPAYYPSMDYVRGGNTIVFRPGKNYLKERPYTAKDISKNIFRHHFFSAYLMLAEAYKAQHTAMK